MSEKLFISDLHLSEQRLETTELFLRFLKERPLPGDQLYILGDLFDVWVGDDDDTRFSVNIRQALKAVSQRGVEIFLQKGNRDFMIGRRFIHETQATLLKDPSIVKIAGQSTLLMHGDLLCSDDIQYQKMRRMLRNPITMNYLKARSLEKRREIARELRLRSGESKAMTAEHIMDANEKTVSTFMMKFGVRQMIHGHTHRPAKHEHILPDHSVGVRWVLPEWHDSEVGILVDYGDKLDQECFGKS